MYSLSAISAFKIYFIASNMVILLIKMNCLFSFDVVM